MKTTSLLQFVKSLELGDRFLAETAAAAAGLPLSTAKRRLGRSELVKATADDRLCWEVVAIVAVKVKAEKPARAKREKFTEKRPFLAKIERGVKAKRPSKGPWRPANCPEHAVKVRRKGEPFWCHWRSGKKISAEA